MPAGAEIFRSAFSFVVLENGIFRFVVCYRYHRFFLNAIRSYFQWIVEFGSVACKKASAVSRADERKNNKRSHSFPIEVVMKAQG